MFTETTSNALNILQAMLCGYAVEIEGTKYAYDQESRRIGVLGKNGDEDFILFCNIDLNRFLSMCEQMDPQKMRDIASVLQHSLPQPPSGPEGAERHFH